MISKQLLQMTILTAGFVPVSAGLYGVINDPVIPHETLVLSDNHFHYLSGLLLAIGVAFWAMIPTIERRSVEVRLLTFIVFIGGLARLYGTLLHGEFSTTIAFALTMELLITPLICLWQNFLYKSN